MTSRPPLEALEAASEESPASPSPGERVEGDSTGEAMTRTEQSEASISKTLEAILSKTDDEDESPLTAEEGAMSFASAGGPTMQGEAALGAPDHAEAGPSISVDAMFDVDVDLDHPHDAPPKWRLPPPGDEKPVGDLLHEVAEALNVQATESNERAIGRAPDTNAAGLPPAVASTPLVAKSREFEFEDPEDGPTTLNSTEQANGIIAAAATAGRDEDEEAVVLGPAKRRGDSRPNSSLPGAPARATLPAPPMPGSRAPGQSWPHRVTPFAGLPAPTLPMFSAPGSGRARLPTPAPGHPALVPSPASGRSTLPLGSPPTATTDAASSAGLGLPDSSRRTTRVSGPLAPLGASGGADASEARHRFGLGIVAEPFNAALSSASTVLKKDVRFRLASLAAIVVVTFVGGILVGRSVVGGKDPDPQTTVARAAGPAPTPPADDRAKSTAAPTPAVEAPAEPPKIEPVAAPPTVAEAAPPGVGPMQFDPQPIHKRRVRRASAAPNEDPALAPAPKGPVRVASITAPSPAGAGKAPTAGKSAPKKKSAWHDPFAD